MRKSLYKSLAAILMSAIVMTTNVSPVCAAATTLSETDTEKSGGTTEEENRKNAEITSSYQDKNGVSYDWFGYEDGTAMIYEMSCERDTIVLDIPSYIDEIYLLFQNEYSAKRLNTMVRRGRKYGAVFTGISQNVTPILESSVARDMLQNCNFIQILGQAGPDRDNLKHILNLSDANVEYITNSPPGQGLIYKGSLKCESDRQCRCVN